MKHFVRRFSWIVHPVTVFVVAQVCWALLVFTWIWWYLDREKAISSVLAKLPVPPDLQAGQWVILLQGGILLALILLGLLTIFISQRKQVRLTRLHESFLSNVTHELKTPIASIRLATETMLMRELNAEDRSKFLNRTLSESIRLQNLVDSILVAARLESKSDTSTKETVDLISVLEQSVNHLKERAAGERTVSYELTSPNNKNHFLIDGDPIQLQMVFDNLFSNAIKYTSSGGTIGIQARLNGKGFFVDITDNGVGIDKQAIAKIFDKFYRAEGTSKIRVQGSGLGLFIARSVVQEHGGELTATSEGPEKGATFHVGFERKNSTRRR